MRNKAISRLIRKICIKIFQLDEWFLYDYSDKDYAQYVVKTVNEMIKHDEKAEGYAIEIGCGLGDVVGNINSQNRIRKIGYDKDKKVRFTASVLHSDMLFLTGSFEQVRKKKIYCLIMVNLLHFIDPDYAKKEIRNLIKNNRVEHVIIDELRDTQNTSYQYECHGNEILGERYVQYYRSRRMRAAEGANRHVVVYKRK